MLVILCMSNNSSSVIIPFKLLESYVTSDVLTAQWDRFKCSCDASKELGLHQQLMKLMQFLMGLDDCYQPVRSSFLTRDPLPKVKDVYNVVSRKESHRGVPESSRVTESKMNASFFATKPLTIVTITIGHTIERCYELVGFTTGFKRFSNSAKQGFNADIVVKQNEKMSSRNSSPGFTFEQMKKLLSLINETPSARHPDGNLATISHIGNLKLTNNVILYDVHVVLGYCVSLVSVNKLIKDSKMFVCFDENKCYIEDWKREKVLGTDSETGGLYMFDMNNDCFVVYLTVVVLYKFEKCVLIGYFTDKKAYKLLSMDSKNVFYSRDARFYENIFPLKPKTCDITDVENTSEVDHLKVLDTQMLKSLNDDGKDTSVEDGSMQPLFDTTDSTQGMYQEGWHSATQVDDQNWSEGNVHSNNPSPTQMVDSLDDVQTPSFRRSTRQFKLLVKLNDYVFSSNIKYRIENFVNYSKIKEAMNNEIEALNRITLGLNVIYLMGGNLLGVNGYGKFSTKPLVMLKDTKPDLWLKGLAREKILIMMELLVQMVKSWNAKLTTALIKQSKFDYSLYVKKKGYMFVALLVYVDDIVITGNDKVEIKSFKDFF
ncbi:ribonuclease H-like domain-containing protein [Tanacetum coccineum]